MRKSGVLLPLFSLRGPYGIGTMGDEARAWLDFLAESKVACWQMLPIGPTGYGNSPYQPFSTFAGNPLLISPDELVVDGLLTAEECRRWHQSGDTIDYDEVAVASEEALRLAFSRFQPDDAFAAFCQKQDWLGDYALFMTAKQTHDQAAWDTWEEDLRLHRPEALARLAQESADEVRYWQFVQYVFAKQWDALRTYARQKGVTLIGDLPIYVALDSADVWAEPSQFQLDEAHRPTAVAGCPPDYFSEDGQLWGNPLYNWSVMRADGFRWWRRRLRHAAALFDTVRVDHFRAFAGYWSIPAGDKTARGGHWEPGPGMDLFRAAAPELANCGILAEDLGVITDDVRLLLKETGFPGMSVLQFAFTPGVISEYLPFRQVHNSVCYTGTHDNDTLTGWLTSLDEETRRFVMRYTHTSHKRACVEALIDMAWGSPADLCVVPLQDLLHLGSEARINTPSVCGGNWVWRVPKGALTEKLAHALRERNETFFR